MKLILSYKYKLRPSNQQFKKLSDWLDMLRASYNWCLKDRCDGWHQQFICGDYCDLKTQVEITPLTCSITKGTQLANPWKEGGGKAKKEGGKDKSPKRTASLMQDANLQELKAARPWYQSIDNEFEIKTVTVRQKADGWYVSVRIENKDIPDFPVISDSEIKTITGCDMGVGKLAYLSDGSSIDNPRFATNKKTKRRMRIRQRRVSRKQKGSKNRAKAQLRVNKLHNKIQQRRESYQWDAAKRILKRSDAVAVEDLPVKNMMKRCKPVKIVSLGY